MDKYKVPDDVIEAGEEYSKTLEHLYTMTDIDFSDTKARNAFLYEAFQGNQLWNVETAYLERYGVEFGEKLRAVFEKYGGNLQTVLATREGNALFEELWQELIFGSNLEQRSMLAEFDTQFNTMMAAFGDHIPEYAREYFRDTIFNSIAGSDGILTNAELSQLGTVFGSTIQQILNVGFENTEWGNQSDIIDHARQKIIDAYKRVFDFKGEAGWGDVTSGLGIDLSMIENDAETLNKVGDLLSGGVLKFDQFKEILEDSTSIEDFNERLNNLKKTVAEPVTTGGSGSAEDASIISTVKSLSDISKDAASNIKTLKEVRDSLKNGEPIEAKDLMAIMEIRPELLGLIGDTDKFTEAVNQSVEQQGDRMLTAAKSFIMNSSDIAKNSPFAHMLENDTDTLQDYVDSMDTSTNKGKAQMAEFDKWMSTVLFSMMDSMGMLGDVSKDTLENIMAAMFPDISPEVLSQTWVDAAELVKKGWQDAGDSIATFSFGRAKNAEDKA